MAHWKAVKNFANEYKLDLGIVILMAGPAMVNYERFDWVAYAPEDHDIKDSPVTYRTVDAAKAAAEKWAKRELQQALKRLGS